MTDSAPFCACKHGCIQNPCCEDYIASIQSLVKSNEELGNCRAELVLKVEKLVKENTGLKERIETLMDPGSDREALLASLQDDNTNLVKERDELREAAREALEIITEFYGGEPPLKLTNALSCPPPPKEKP